MRNAVVGFVNRLSEEVCRFRADAEGLAADSRAMENQLESVCRTGEANVQRLEAVEVYLREVQSATPSASMPPADQAAAVLQRPRRAAACT